MEKISIKGLDKAEVLAALHNGTQPLGMGRLQAIPEMTVEMARGYLKRGDDHAEGLQAIRDQGGIVIGHEPMYFDYLCGRPLKIDISTDEIDPRLYDRDAGEGACARAIASIRK